ncbi:parvulin-like peptidyl-prolyl isomerase, partial [Candidatus Scalindua japonica]
MLEKEERILQAGIQIRYSKNLSSSNFNEHYKKIIKVAESYYGVGKRTQEEYYNIEVLEYCDNKTKFYISKSNVNATYPVDLLTFRAGNSQFWRRDKAINSVIAHVLDQNRGYYIDDWEIDVDIARDDVEGFVTPEGELFVIITY